MWRDIQKTDYAIATTAGPTGDSDAEIGAIIFYHALQPPSGIIVENLILLQPREKKW